MSTQTKIGITMGDPKGIGAEIIVKALSKLSPSALFTVYGDESVFRQASQLTGLSFSATLKKITSHPYSPLEVNAREAGLISAACLQRAVSDCLGGSIDAIVTAPINKHHWQLAGIPFAGHTDYLAHLSHSVTGQRKILQTPRGLPSVQEEGDLPPTNAGSPYPTHSTKAPWCFRKVTGRLLHSKQTPCMMMKSPTSAISLVTTHLPLRDVADHITQEKIEHIAEISVEFLRKRFHIDCPKVAVLALNPHAGDEGTIGHEEREIIIPAILALRKKGIDVSGPFPADTFFIQQHDPLSAFTGYDLIVAMYHDQALIPIKMLDFEHTINITLGIPFVRTSVDHGTAENIAWKGVADATNMIAAIEMAEYLIT